MLMTTTRATAARRERNRRGEGDRLRGEIVDAAIDLLAETGDLRALTLRGVARRLGIAATSIYLHFPDVESLAETALESVFDRFDAARDAAAAEVIDPCETLHARAGAYCRFALDNPGLYRAMFDSDRPPSARGQRSFETLVRTIERCQDAGAAQQEDATIVAARLWATLHGLASLRINRPRFRWPASLDQDVDRTVTAIVGLEP
jgi:AcrR family transcriptional regulator